MKHTPDKIAGLRNQLFYRIIAALNDADKAYPQAIHCHELGICALFFDRYGNWDCTWYDYQSIDDVAGVAHETE